MKRIALVLSFLGLLASQAAFAGPECTKEPKEKWMSELDMQKKLVGELNYIIYKFKTTDGNCYEIYGKGLKKDSTTEMQEVEIYFNPVDASIVEQKVEG
ncbi:PepSY domain-containing protein [Thiolinea disciformis]|uniref:PepSY domain-containing protein n=1 Tax=Thiolinea disciformis TaxID=125614 RepID=UPI00038068F0|nr:PepSY domain-containing protein [Thiolinea disciformis]